MRKKSFPGQSGVDKTLPRKSEKMPPNPEQVLKDHQELIAEKSGKENQVAGNIHGSATLGENWRNIPAVASFGQDSHGERLNASTCYVKHMALEEEEEEEEEDEEEEEWTVSG